MARLKLSKWKLLVALVWTRRVAAKYNPELKLLSFLFTILVGNKLFDSDTAEFVVCTLALVRKYGKISLLNIFG